MRVMPTPPAIKVIWASLEDPGSDELLYQAYRIILGDEIGSIRDDGIDEKTAISEDKNKSPPALTT
jgi:hypothetical protein